MEAKTTANGDVAYEDVYHGRTMDEWIQAAHKFNCKTNGWSFNLLRKGSYGYDNICMGLYFVFTNPGHCKAEEIHKGWIANYTFWRDNEPYNRSDVIYHKPYKPLNDERRNKCAETEYNDLPASEMAKDIIFAKFLDSALNE